MEDVRYLSAQRQSLWALLSFAIAAMFLGLAPFAAQAGVFDGDQNGSLRESLELEGCYAENIAIGQNTGGDDVLYLACNAASGIFVSEDGETWTPATETGADYGAPIDVAASDDESDVAYMIAGIQLWKTSDAGASWDRIGESDDVSNVGQRLVYDRGVLMATYRSDSQIIVSSDQGDSFSFVDVTSDGSGAVYDFARDADGTWYALAGSEDSTTLYSSSDDGATWTTTGKSGNYSSVGAHPSNTQILVLAGDDAVEVSTDGGSTWTETDHATPEDVERIAIAGNGNIVAAGYVSTDSGNSWTAFTDDTVDLRPDFFSTDSSGNLYMKSGQGIAKSTDNGSDWTEYTDGLVASRIYDFTISSNKKVAWVASYGAFVKATNFKRTTRGRLPTWTVPTQPADNIQATDAVWVHPTSTDTVLVAVGGEVYRTTNGGTSWSSVSTGGSGNVNDFAYDAENDIVYVAHATAGVFKSTDTGATWSTTSLTNAATALAVDGNGNVLAGMGTEDTTDAAGLGIYMYDGSSWTQLSSTGFDSSWVSDVMYVSATDSVYVGTTDSDGMGTVYRSKDSTDWSAWKAMTDLPEDLYGPTLAAEDNGLMFYVGSTRPAGTGYIYKCTATGKKCGVYYTGLVDETFDNMIFDDFVTVGSGMYRYESKATLTLKKLSKKKAGKHQLRATLKDTVTGKNLKNKKIKLLRKSGATFKRVKAQKVKRTNAKGKATFGVRKKGQYKVRWVPQKSIESAAYTTRVNSTKKRVKKTLPLQ